MRISPNATVDRITCFLALTLSIFGQACFDEDPTELSSAREAETREAAAALRGDLGESPLMMDLAREIPGFAGVFFEPGGDRLVLSMTEGAGTGFPEARQAALARLAADVSPPSMAYRTSSLEVVRRVAEYSFIDWRDTGLVSGHPCSPFRAS